MTPQPNFILPNIPASTHHLYTIFYFVSIQHNTILFHTGLSVVCKLAWVIIDWYDVLFHALYICRIVGWCVIKTLSTWLLFAGLFIFPINLTYVIYFVSPLLVFLYLPFGVYPRYLAILMRFNALPIILHLSHR